MWAMQDAEQGMLFPELAEDRREIADRSSSTFTKNMSLPVHSWFRYSAGFSATWVEQVIRERSSQDEVRVLDPFAGSGTTLLVAESIGCASIGLDPHPFVSRVARAKLEWYSDPEEFSNFASKVIRTAEKSRASTKGYPPLVYKCYDTETLAGLGKLRRALEKLRDDSSAYQLAWLAFIAIIRKASHAGTAQWQYVLPNKRKSKAAEPFAAYAATIQTMYNDMRLCPFKNGPRATFLENDARTCEGVSDDWANLVVTSPPYPNNYDYADAVRLELCVLKEIAGWSDLQASIRNHLLRSCTQHVPPSAADLDEVLSSEVLEPIRDEISTVCRQLSDVRLSKSGKKTYHLMVACYFRDLAEVWHALRRVCCNGADLCFVIGDSAPYGVYVPVIPWLGKLAISAGFKSYSFERTRNRNIKWKNRKHRVPLQEGRLWVKG